MATDPGQRFVRRHDAARTSTANGTAADLSYDTAVLSEGGYSWSSPEVAVDEAGLYLMLFDMGYVDLASTRAVGTLVPSINTVDQTRFRATHRYLRSSGGNEGASFGAAILDLAVSDDVKVRNPGALTPTDAVGNYATRSGDGGGIQLIRLPAENFTHLERTSDAAEVGTSNINTTRPWLDSSGTWSTVTYNSEVNDDDGLYPGSGGTVTLAASTKYMVVWGFTPYSTDASRHTYAGRLQIDSANVQTASSYQRNTASQGAPVVGVYLHETGGSAEDLIVQATHETEGGDAGTPNIADAYLQIIELPSSAEWIHADNGSTDSLTTALAGTTTWYDTPLSSTFRADGDSNLSLDGANDAVQNDSGGTLPVLAIGWQRWDRDSGTSGTRKAPVTTFENGGTRLGYGLNSAFSRGQQSGDDTFQAHPVSAATMDLANAADLKLVVNDAHSGSNADMGVYASTSRHFLGLQVLNLETLDAGGAGEDALLADDVESSSEVSSPALGQEHALLADDVESASEVSAPSVGQEHSLAADDVESASEASSPDLAQVYVLTANDVESASEVSAPVVGQEHTLTSVDVESASETSSPAIGQEHSLTATSTESASEASQPVLGQEHVLGASSVESASEVSTASLGQEHALLADDAESTSEVSIPALVEVPPGVHPLLAEDVESATEVSIPTLVSAGLESGLVPGRGYVDTDPPVGAQIRAMQQQVVEDMADIFAAFMRSK